MSKEVLRKAFTSRVLRHAAQASVLLGLFRGPGCGSDAESAFDDGARSDAGAATGRGSGAEGTTSFADEDAGPPPTSPFRGNPLCKVTGTTCMPDDDGLRSSAGTTLCAEPITDAGVTDEEGPACRLVRAGNASAAPDCLAGKHAGTDGATCAAGADCAPGFDCVDTGGVLQCRHYCCQDTCAGAATQSGSAAFCDIQKLVDTTEVAPVCMPLKPCTLLAPDQCAADETCAVVTPGGATGCVSVGKARVFESCDQAHCGAGLTCIGQVGTRKCYQLCKVGQAGSCGEGLACKTSTVFADPAFGVCQTSM